MKFSIKLPMLGLLSCSFLLIINQGCKKSKGELGSPATASFTVSPVAGKINTFALKSSSQGATRLQWDKGDGSALKGGGEEDTVYYLKKGEYTVTLYAYGRGGYTTATQKITVAEDDPSSLSNDPIIKLLVAKTWKFDPDPAAAAIIVGTEGNPGQYYGGGPLADCQIDDRYKFVVVSNTQLDLAYDAKGSTFNGGNVAPNYSCATDRSFTSAFTFSKTVDGTGIATITIPGANPPDKFIGVTDIPSNNFRIISLTATSMVLRAGTKDGTVFQFKFIAE